MRTVLLAAAFALAVGCGKADKPIPNDTPVPPGIEVAPMPRLVAANQTGDNKADAEKQAGVRQIHMAGK